VQELTALPSGLFDEVDRIGQSIQALTETNIRDRNPLQETKQLWLNLISRMDNLENIFDRAAERACEFLWLGVLNFVDCL
jgi:hypothetical protein